MQSEKMKMSRKILSVSKKDLILKLRMHAIKMRMSRFVLFTAIKNSLANLLNEDLNDVYTRKIIVNIVLEIISAKLSLKDIDPDFANLFYKNLDPFVSQLLADKEREIVDKSKIKEAKEKKNIPPTPPIR